MKTIATQSAMDSITPTEHALAEMWKDILNLENVKKTDNFFDLGGNSLSAIKLLSRVEDQFGIGTLLADKLFQEPELRALAFEIDRCKGHVACD